MAGPISQDGYREPEYIIPKNLGNSYGLVSDTIADIPVRNWIDAVICAAVIFLLIRFLPLPATTKIIIIVTGIILSTTINVIGLKGESISQFIKGYIEYSKSRKQYTLSPILFAEDAVTSEEEDG